MSFTKEQYKHLSLTPLIPAKIFSTQKRGGQKKFEGTDVELTIITEYNEKLVSLNRGRSKALIYV